MTAVQFDMLDGRRMRRNQRKSQALESQEQEALFRWARLNVKRYPELAVLHHIPNGGGRTPWEGRALKRRGVLAGVPDICLPAPRNGHGSLYIELKRVGEGGSTSQAQKRVIEALRAVGNKVHVCEGWESAKEAIVQYLGVK